MLGYRTLFQAGPQDGDVLGLAERAFRHWLRTKHGLRLDSDHLEFDEPVSTADGARVLLTREETQDGSLSIRAVLGEWNAAGRWTTTLTASAPPAASPWVWIDVDGPEQRPDNSGRRQWTATPRLAVSLLEQLHAHDGLMELDAGPQRIFADDIDRLIDIICDPQRRGLAFVAGTNEDLPWDKWSQHVAQVLRDATGLAGRFILDSEATASLAAALGASHAVAPGTIRTFKPGADPASSVDALRHRILGTHRLVEDDPSHLRRMLGWAARTSVIDQPLPRDVLRLNSRFEARANELLLATLTAPPRPAATPAPAPPSAEEVTAASAVVVEAEWIARISAAVRAATGSSAAPEELLTEAIRLIKAGGQAAPANDFTAIEERLADLSARLTESQETNQQLRSQLDDELIDHYLTYEELEEVTRNRDWLRQALVRRGESEAAFGDAPQPEAGPGSFLEVLDLLADLPFLSFTGDEATALALDEQDPTGRWARRTWEALRAVNDYARAKATGAFSGSVSDYLKSPPPSFAGFSANRHAHQESETVRNSPRYRQHRELPVPTSIDPSGTVYMGAHFKIAQAGLVSPRMHYFDATGRDQRIYIGYLGPHLPTTRTN